MKERYKAVPGDRRWVVVDTEEFEPFLAVYYEHCPDAESMAKSLASWLNSGPEA